MAPGIAGTLSSMVTTIGGQTDVGDNAGHKATPGIWCQVGWRCPKRSTDTADTDGGADTSPDASTPRREKTPSSDKPAEKI